MKWYYKNGAATTHSTLFGYRRRNVFILLAIILCSIILIIGLSVGLTRNKSSTYFSQASSCILTLVKTFLFPEIQAGYSAET
jgi:hypothetical protein